MSQSLSLVTPPHPCEKNSVPLRKKKGSALGVLMKPVVSKADPTGAFWCDKPIYFPYKRYDPICAARELIQQELQFPVAEHERVMTPLFAMTRNSLSPKHRLIRPSGR